MLITRFPWLDGKVLVSSSAARARDQVDRHESAIRRLSRRQWLGSTRSVPLRHRLLAFTLKRVA